MSQHIIMVLLHPKYVRVFNPYVPCRCCYLTASGPPKALIDNEIIRGIVQNIRPSMVSLLLYRKLTWMLYSAFCYTIFYPRSICLPNHLASLVASHEEACCRPFLTGVTLCQAALFTCCDTGTDMMNDKRLRHSFLLLESVVYQIQMVGHTMDDTRLKFLDHSEISLVHWRDKIHLAQLLWNSTFLK